MTFVGPHSRLGLAVAAIVFAVDQLQKAWTVAFFQSTGKARIEVTPFLDLVMAWNAGISYGLFKQDTALGRAILIGIALAAIAGLVYWLAQQGTRVAAISLGLIAGGAAGNAMDRVIYGAVADFFSFHVAGFYWYVFNIADVAITFGVAGLLYDWVKSGHKSAGNSIYQK